MEKLESREKVINLGKLLVKELNLNQSVDTLGRWMAHYLAIKMNEVEDASGIEKSILEKECFDTILEIWSHRWNLPSNSKPLRNFKPIFDFLVKLNPDRERPFYFDNAITDKKEAEAKKIFKRYGWLEIAKDADKYARICIDQALNNAALELSSTEQAKWLSNIPRLTEDVDVNIIKIVLHREKDSDQIDGTEKSKVKLIKKIEIEKLQSNIDFLQNFKKIHGKLLRDLRQKLAALSNN
ncbi:MAG: hypothetical protein H7339_17000 [Arcicella sp.]|nr:hypothetical protein [Arcicella sp.]